MSGWVAAVALMFSTGAALPRQAATPGRDDAIAQSREAEGISPGQLLDLRLRGGGDQRVLYLSPAKPVAVVVMLPGGAGDIGLEGDGGIRHGNNFLVRTRDLWVQHGYAVLIPDTIDHASLRGDRSSADYAAAVVDLAGFARSRASAPVFLLGTSQGAIAAVNGAAHAPQGLISGLILTESVSRIGGSGESVFSAAPQDVRVPALVVANRDDQCDVAPPPDAPRIVAAMRNSPDAHVAFVNGGTAASGRACGSLTPHGYYGIEPQVVDLIAGWMEAHR
ncbi:MAG: alpha/beta hydrolase [Xanthobacteraceae bacterium]|nr:alpha/beta hydrolase [Xanthobacteraceae bacterium]